MTPYHAFLNKPCPCQSTSKSPISFSNCCFNFINQTQNPLTAEQLMRSRYTAFVIEDEAYLLKTWHSKTRPTSIQFDPLSKWLGLKVKATELGNKEDQIGWVTFVARYKITGKAHRLEENSYFSRESGQWCYVSEDKSHHTRTS